jgi:arylsulfatase A-like enzyme
LVLLAGLACACSESGPAGSPAGAAPVLSGANVIIISLDTLRADGTSMAGRFPELSPTLQRLADEGVYFSHARAQAPHTAPSHMSLFTSTYPSVHGVQNVAHETAEDGSSRAVIYPLRENIPTLAEILSASGYRCVGLTDGGNLNPPHGFDRGFEHYSYDLSGAEAQVADGLGWVRQLAAPGGEPFLLFWHTYQIHAPYVPPEPYLSNWAPAGYEGLLKERIEQLSGLDFKQRFGLMRTLFWKDKQDFGWPESAYLHGLYRGEVRFTDDQLTRLIDGLRESGLLERSILVVLSDHGEEFFEHGQWQHDQLYEECLRVPLIVRLPGGFGGGRTVDTPVALLDVMPTLLELLGIEPDEAVLPGPVRSSGRSLAATLLGGEPPRPRPIISEHLATRGPNFDQQLAVHANGWKLIYDEVRGERLPDGSVRQLRSLYDLAQDPTEQADLADRESERLQTFLELREGFRTLVELEQARAGGQVEIEADEEMLRQLEELGYIGG